MNGKKGHGCRIWVFIIGSITPCINAQAGSKLGSDLQKMAVNNIRIANKTPYKLSWRPKAEVVMQGTRKRESIGKRGVQKTRSVAPNSSTLLFAQGSPYTLASVAQSSAIESIIIEEVYFEDNQRNKVSLGYEIRCAFDGAQKTGCQGFLSFFLNKNGQLTYEYSVACP